MQEKSTYQWWVFCSMLKQQLNHFPINNRKIVGNLQFCDVENFGGRVRIPVTHVSALCDASGIEAALISLNYLIKMLGLL